MAKLADRLAFLAIAPSPKDDSQRLAVIVGTRGDDTSGSPKWYARLVRADVLEAAFSSDRPDDLKSLFDLPQDQDFVRYHWLEEAPIIGVSDGVGNATEPVIGPAGGTGKNRSLWINGLTRVHFFRGDAEMGHPRLPEPLVALDVAGSATFSDAVAASSYAVSRVRLDAGSSWLGTDGVLNLGQELTAFRMVCHIPLALGVHKNRDTEVGRAQRYDTRAILVAHAVRDNQRGKCLWLAGDEAKSARFRILELGFSEAGAEPGVHPANLLDLRRITDTKQPDRTFDDLVGAGRAYLVDTNPGRHLPLFSEIDDFRDQPPKTLAPTRRSIGFRHMLSARSRLALRAELDFSISDVSAWKEPWGSFAEPVTGLAPLDTLALGDAFWLAQEQLSETLVTAFNPPAVAPWLLTARFDQDMAVAVAGSAMQSFESKLVDFLKDVHVDLGEALHFLRPETGATILPDIENLTGAPLPWHVVGVLKDDMRHRRLYREDAKSPISWRNARHPGRIVELLSFQPRLSNDLWVPGTPLNACGVKLALTSVRQATALPQNAKTITPPFALARSGRAQLMAPLPADAELGPAAWALQPPHAGNGIVFQVIATASPDPQLVHIGGLELGFRANSLPDAKPVTFTFAIGKSWTGKLDRAAMDVSRVDLLLIAASLSPVDQDPLPDHQSARVSRQSISSVDDTIWKAPESAITLNLTPPETTSRGFKLEGQETFGGAVERSEATDQEVVWTLARKDQATPIPPSNLLLLDSGLFRVMVVEAQFASDGPAEIGFYRRQDDGEFAWRVIDPLETVNIVMGPQILGEAMEKNAVTSLDKPQDIAIGKPAAARFGSLTRLAIDPTYRATHTREPAWNLRRIFNRVSSAVPGALVRDLRIELAYGMVARLIPQRETRIAEIGAIIGAPPEPIVVDAIGRDRDVARYNTRALAAPNHRLAVDKLWAGRPEDEFETTEGLTFQLRTKDQKDSRSGPETPFRFPVADGHDRVEDDQRFKDTFAPPLEPGMAFPGGVPWAFQSVNILREVYRDPATHDGRLTGIHLSALGGWGRMRAAFAGGKSVVETETDMGRMSFYKLERVGRIGGLGHRAKHVIVYRRTVAPSAQFYNRAPIGLKQDEHAGRPILRKVEEYVEILEPERRYPENGTAVREAGCLSGARFTTRRMLVDPDWGGDVRNEGWMVPLWQKDLAAAGKTSDPDGPTSLYPKPVVHMLMPGEGDAEVAIEVDTPERLVFYTSTLKSETADTVNQWHAVEGIDFCDAPAPIVRTASWDDGPAYRNALLHNGMLPSAPRRAVGHEALTLDLVEAQLPVRLTAGRSEKGAAAALKNITISRARPRSALPVASTAPANERDEAARRAGERANELASTIRARLDNMFGKIAGQFESLWREGLQGEERAIEAVDKARASLIAELRALQSEIGKRAKALSDDLEKAQFDPVAVAGKLRTDVAQKLEDELDLLARRCIGLLHDEAERLVNGIDDPAATLKAKIAGVRAKFIALKVGDAVADAQSALTVLLNTEAAHTLAAIDKAADDARDEYEDARALLHPNRQGIDRILGVQDAVDGSRVAIQEKANALQASIGAFVGKIAAWSSPIDEQELKTYKADALAFLGERIEQCNQIHTKLRSLAGSEATPAAVRSVARSASTLVDKLENQLAALKIVADGLAWPIVDFEVPRAALLQSCSKLDAAVKSVVTALESGIGTVRDQFVDEVGKFRDALSANSWFAGIGDTIQTTRVRLKDAVETVRHDAADIIAATGAASAEIVARAHEIAATLIDTLDAAADTARAALVSAAQGAETQLVAKVAEAKAAAQPAVDALASEAHSILQKAAEATVAPAQDWNEWADHLQRQICDTSQTADEMAAEIERRIDQFADALKQTIRKTGGTIDACRKAIEEAVAGEVGRIRERIDGVLGDVSAGLARQLGIQPGELVDGVITAADDAKRLYQEGDNVLRLIRAVGDPPKTDGLGLNRPEVAYVFDALKPIVDITPAIAFANKVNDTANAVKQAGQALGDLGEALGVRNMIDGVADDLVPASLKDLSISKLFPSMAGLDLEGLLKDAVFPDLATQKDQGVPITRGFDKEKNEAWLQADIDVKLDKSATILELGPVALMLDKGHFKASSRIQGGLSGEPETVAKGQISGDWRLVSAGMDVLTFEQTPLLFDKSGKIDFKIASERVKLAPSLEFLTNLLAKAKQSVPSGVEPIMRDGAPVGIVAKLAMALPPIQTGAFGITDLTLGASFAIIAVPEFEILASLDIASRDAPFTLAVWLLNGGGYISQRLSYAPLAKPVPLLTYTLDISICAGVGIGFGFGFVSGGVWLQVGCSVALNWTTGSGGNVTTVTAFLLARGNVDVAGLVTAGIALRLEIFYDGSEMIARGNLRLSFRISCFYTLKVNQGAQYHLVGERRAEPAPDYAATFG